MGSSDDPRERTDANFQDATGRRAERSPLDADAASSRATAPAGGTGRQSGNGQMRPHRGFGAPSGQDALGEPTEPEAIVAMPDNGPTYQTGGIGLDRAQHVAERKRRESGVGSTKGHGADGQGGGFDPPPGAPTPGSGRVG